MADLNTRHSAAHHHRASAPGRARRMGPSTRRFVRHYVEMVVAMLRGMVVLAVPVALLEAGDVDDTGVLLVAEHVAMLVGPLGVMLLRRAEYTHHHARPHAEPQIAV